MALAEYKTTALADVI